MPAGSVSSSSTLQIFPDANPLWWLLFPASLSGRSCPFTLVCPGQSVSNLFFALSGTVPPVVGVSQPRFTAPFLRLLESPSLAFRHPSSGCWRLPASLSGTLPPVVGVSKPRFPAPFHRSRRLPALLSNTLPPVVGVSKPRFPAPFLRLLESPSLAFRHLSSGCWRLPALLSGTLPPPDLALYGNGGAVPPLSHCHPSSGSTPVS